MPPFAQFRLWLREGPLAERRAAFVALALFALFGALALVPLEDDGPGGGDLALSSESAAGAGQVTGQDGGTAETGPVSAPALAATTGTAPGASAGSAAGPAPAAGPEPGAAALSGAAAAGRSGTDSAVAGGAASGGSGVAVRPRQPAGTTRTGTSAAAPAACGQLAASSPGITADEVRIAYAQADLAGPVGNEAFDLRDDVPEIVAAVVDHINDNGGVACGRKLVAKSYNVNPTDFNDQQAKCLKMAQDKNFIVVNGGAYASPVSYQCFVNVKVPLQHGGTVSAGQVRNSYPYLFGTGGSIEQAVRNGVLGAAARGFFKRPAFTKLGLLADSCVPDANAEMDRDLAASGVPKRDVVKYTLDCQLVAGQNQLAQAVVQMKSAGVSHVLLTAGLINSQNFTRLAGQQGLRPRYAVTDKGTNTAANGAGNWDTSFDGAIAVTATRSGEINAGVRNPQVQACDKILTSRGVPGVKREDEDSLAGGVCDSLFFFQRAVALAGANPTRLSLVQNLGRIGLFPTAVHGDGLWNVQGKLQGADFQRQTSWTKSCRCWKATERTFGPRY